MWKIDGFMHIIFNVVCQKIVSRFGAGSSNLSASSSSKEQQSQPYPGLSMERNIPYVCELSLMNQMQN